MDHILTFIGVHPLLTGSFVAVLVLFVVNETQRGGKTIGAQALVDWVNQRNALVLDVRDRKAFSTGHIAQSLNIPFATLEKSLGELESHRGRPLVLVCLRWLHRARHPCCRTRSAAALQPAHATAGPGGHALR